MISLLDDLVAARTNRPDEWTMDRFIRKAKIQQVALDEIINYLSKQIEDVEIMREVAKAGVD